MRYIGVLVKVVMVEMLRNGWIWDACILKVVPTDELMIWIMVYKRRSIKHNFKFFDLKNQIK